MESRCDRWLDGYYLYLIVWILDIVSMYRMGVLPVVHGESVAEEVEAVAHPRRDQRRHTQPDKTHTATRRSTNQIACLGSAFAGRQHYSFHV